MVWDLDLFGQLTPQQEEGAFLSAEFLAKVGSLLRVTCYLVLLVF
jgi:hypothetical protein